MATFERTDTYNKLVDVVAQKLTIGRERITPQSTFQDLGADSLDMVEIVMKLEEVFGIEIKDEDAEKFSTLNSAVDYLQQVRTK